jgi:hypothetical protein
MFGVVTSLALDERRLLKQLFTNKQLQTSHPRLITRPADARETLNVYFPEPMNTALEKVANSMILVLAPFGGLGGLAPGLVELDDPLTG